MTDRSATVLITGVGGGAVGYELLQALRLSPVRYRIVGVDAAADSLGLLDADAAVVVPPANHPDYLDAILDVCRKESVQALLPGSEPELRVLSAKRARLANDRVLLLANDPHVLKVGFDKAATLAALQAGGFDVPRFAILTDDASVAAVDWFPCVVKPAQGGSGSNLVSIARTRGELEFFAVYLRDSGFIPTAQEYVGTGEGEYTVGVLSSLSGHLVGSLALRRQLRGLGLKSRVPARGGGVALTISSGISQGVVEYAPRVQEVCERMASALGSKGPLNVQLRLSKGRVMPFEVNPRFSGTCCLRALAGFNEPDILLRHHLFGDSLEQVWYRRGHAMRGIMNRFVATDTDEQFPHEGSGPVPSLELDHK